MYTIQDLVRTIRNPELHKGVITTQEAQGRVNRHRSMMQLSIMGNNNLGYCVTKAVVFIDCYEFGYGVLSKKWVSSSTHFPMHIVPRPELPSGVVATVEDYMKIFHDEETVVLQTTQEFVDYLNK